MSRDYLSIHSLAPNERVQRPESQAPNTLGTPSCGPASAGGWEPYNGAPSAGGVDRLAHAKAMLTQGAAMIDDSDHRATYLDLVRFIDSASEAIETMDILADLAAARRADQVRAMRAELLRQLDIASATR